MPADTSQLQLRFELTHVLLTKKRKKARYFDTLTNTSHSAHFVTSARTRAPINIPDIIYGSPLRALKPGGTVELERRLVAVVLDILAAVERVGDQFLQHLRAELDVAYAEGEVRLGDRAHVHLRGQIVLDDRLRRVLDGLELALDEGRWEPTVAVYIDPIDVVLRVAEQRKLLACLSVLGC